jgi:histidine triad (HIT) family protein
MSDADCLFCRIVAGEVPSDQVAADDGVIAVRDIAPRAPVHVLVVPARHIASAHELTDDDADLLAACFRLGRTVAEQEHTAHGYRLTTNVGADGGQAIQHLHFHVLGGRPLGHIDSGDPPAA